MSITLHHQNMKRVGVINLTPNSFSDGEANREGLVARKLLEWAFCDVIDVGAESTAPHNAPISFEEEKKRLETELVPHLKSWPKEISLSLDTYRLETIQWFMKIAPTHLNLIWNDISGLVDKDLCSFLADHPQLKYILSFNPMRSRENVQAHMDHQVEGSIVEAFKHFFDKSFNQLIQSNVYSQVIADPVFGFAKTREQNHSLCRQMPELMESFACPRWMWGVSRKRFMRFPETLAVKEKNNQELLDAQALILYQYWLAKLTHPHTIYVRTHRPYTLGALKSFEEMQQVWMK